jgi:pilus assembly protein Flp/PilA
MRNWMLAYSGRFGRAATKLAEDKCGVTMLEYGLIAALIAAVCVGAVTSLGSNINNAFTSVAGSI